MLPEQKVRKQDYYFEYPFEKMDTIVYHLPEGFTVEILPKPRNLQFVFGSFITDYHFDEKQRTITTVASLILKQNKLSPQNFEETTIFFNKVLEELPIRLLYKKSLISPSFQLRVVECKTEQLYRKDKKTITMLQGFHNTCIIVNNYILDPHSLCRMASYKIMPAATETLSDSKLFIMGILKSSSQAFISAG